ncbi:MAG: mechanosensitive ion channel [Gammaproteobacteria bacterium]|nr:MAG: mechanosensitive ion channel [Gammaproteobacteria bacterium]
MNEHVSILSGLSQSFSAMLITLIEFLPRILAALLVLVIGWLIAKAVRSLSIRLVNQLDKFWQKIVSSKGLVSLQPRHPPARFVGEILFWLTILITVVMTTEILGLSIFVSWLSEIVSYLPLLISGLLIVLAGFIVSSLVRDLVASGMASAGMHQGDVVGRLVQVVILFTSIVIGTDQVGIDVTFLSVISAIILAATLGSVALAFGLGAKNYVANIIAAHYLRNDIRVGDRIQIDEIEGAVAEITNTRIIIDSRNGRVSLPASMVDGQAFTIEKIS